MLSRTSPAQPSNSANAPHEPPHPDFDALHFRSCLGQFASGVTIVTAVDAAGQPLGLTVSSFSSVSLTPPLVLWSLSRHAHTLPALQTASHYAINVLAANQKALALRFALRGVDRFADVAWTPGAGGAPLLAGTVAQFECANHQQHEAGDHVIFVGRVVHCRHRDGTPLLYHGGHLFDEGHV